MPEIKEKNKRIFDSELVKRKIITAKEIERVEDGLASFNVYAEFTNKQIKQISSGEYQICYPNGVEMNWKYGSKACWFSCNEEDVLEQLIDGLDNCLINWQLDVN